MSRRSRSAPRRKRQFGYANVVSTLALFLVLAGGTAYAAHHYLITKTGQIKPSVLKSLKGKTGPAGPAGSTGPAGPASGFAGGALSGSYPNPGINDSVVQSRVTGTCATAGTAINSVNADGSVGCDPGTVLYYKQQGAQQGLAYGSETTIIQFTRERLRDLRSGS